jgi:lipopolysaccharide transport system ATP-binding protein
MTILSIQNVGKAFRSYQSEWHRFARWFGVNKKSADERWVLRHINFDIYPGEAIGIVGQNGAGKSTLLKLITGTLHPTEGKVSVNGRIAAILELGMGFNPELTGRQNVYHAAGLMGFSSELIAQAMPDIEAFAEIEDYFDEPVRTYSSGMQMRVAFSIATAYRPEILIVDEALSVGDTYFQHKSFDRIRKFREQGTTLLIVSHDKNAIQSLCSRAILLERGSVVRDGDPEEIFDFYSALIAEKEHGSISTMELEHGKSQVSSGTLEASFREISLQNEKNMPAEFVSVGEIITLRVTVDVNQDIRSLVLGCGIKDRLGQMMFGTNTFHTKQLINKPMKGDVFVYEIKFAANLGVGSYSVHASLVEENSHIDKNFQWVDRALVFSVINRDKHEFVGNQWNEMTFDIRKIEK